MPVRRWLAQTYWRYSSFRLTGHPIPRDTSAILIGAPHTSNWDFLLALAVVWRHEIGAKVLVKHTFFVGPLGVALRAVGGVPVDRANPGELIADLVTQAREGAQFALVLAPEGTRGRAEGWKSGFYRVARATGLPVIPVRVDKPSGTLHVGQPRHLTGEVAADMDWLREFYAGAQGVWPGKGSPVRLRDESRPPPTFEDTAERDEDTGNDT